MTRLMGRSFAEYGKDVGQDQTAAPPADHSWHGHVAVHSLGQVCFPFCFDTLKMSLIGFQLRAG
jgi:hypothetical protein